MKTQATISKIEDWGKDWNSEINPSESMPVTVILRNQNCSAVPMGIIAAPGNNEVKYIRLTLVKPKDTNSDKKLTK
jgi:hypothetical protein